MPVRLDEVFWGYGYPTLRNMSRFTFLMRRTLPGEQESAVFVITGQRGVTLADQARGEVAIHHIVASIGQAHNVSAKDCFRV